MKNQASGRSHPTELSFISARTGIELAIYWCVHSRLALRCNHGVLLFLVDASKLIYVIFLEHWVHICILQGELYKRWLKAALANIVEPYGQYRKRKKSNSGFLCFLRAQQSQQEDL
jgi:hypothetical protein